MPGRARETPLRHRPGRRPGARSRRGWLCAEESICSGLTGWRPEIHRRSANNRGTHDRSNHRAMSSERNPVVHLELHTSNLPRAVDFYTRLLEWRVEAVRHRGASYQLLDLGERLEGGVVEHEGGDALWVPYARVGRWPARLSARWSWVRASVLAPREGPAGWRSVAHLAVEPAPSPCGNSGSLAGFARRTCARRVKSIRGDLEACGAARRGSGRAGVRGSCLGRARVRRRCLEGPQAHEEPHLPGVDRRPRRSPPTRSRSI